MDRDWILALLVLILIIQGVLLYENPNVQILYTRLKALERELEKTRPAQTLCTGAILESANKMTEGLFVNARLLIVSYEAQEGTKAVFLNRRSLYRSKQEVIKFGGPMDVLEQFYLHDNKRILNCSKVVEGVYFGGEVRRSSEVNTRILTFSGMMKWPAGALEAEIARGLWRVRPLARAENIFADLRMVP